MVYNYQMFGVDKMNFRIRDLLRLSHVIVEKSWLKLQRVTKVIFPTFLK